MGTPLRPMEQLMAVLPPDSSQALPLPYARLMKDPESPIQEFYPDKGATCFTGLVDVGVGW
jgi:5'-3' exoribonuclease 2